MEDFQRDAAGVSQTAGSPEGDAKSDCKPDDGERDACVSATDAPSAALPVKDAPPVGRLGSGEPLDWSLVPFEVCCPRCGCDVHGRAEPVCPQCGLGLDWAELVPLAKLTCLHCGYLLRGLTETRCPECGRPFTWEEALDDYRRRRKPLFEYRWRDAPIRSAMHTWLWCLWPPKLWRSIDLHDPPQLRPLIVWAAAGIIGLALGLGVLPVLLDWAIHSSYARSAELAFGTGMRGLTQTIAIQVTNPYHQSFFYFVVIWVLCSLAALMLFRQSMNRCRIRSPHMFRVWAYGIATVLPTAVVFFFCALLVLARSLHFFGQTLRGYPVFTLIIVLAFVYSVWSVWRASGTYLRMPHSLGVALASQLMALLATSTLCDVILPYGFTLQVLYPLLDRLGLV